MKNTFMNRIKSTMLATLLLGSLVLMNGSIAGAAANCDSIETTFIQCNSDGGNPVVSLLLQLINFLAIGVGLAVVGGIIWGGLVYASSNGDSGKVQQAKTIIVNAVIGLLLFIFLYAIVNFLVPGGLFT